MCVILGIVGHRRCTHPHVCCNPMEHNMLGRPRPIRASTWAVGAETIRRPAPEGILCVLGMAMASTGQMAREPVGPCQRIKLPVALMFVSSIASKFEGKARHERRKSKRGPLPGPRRIGTWRPKSDSKCQ